LTRGDYQQHENVFITLFRADWIDAAWNEYAEVEQKMGLIKNGRNTK
jgi:hypothetical protein